ncbi:MAG: PQQ-binding-like beta-propeller repeat protein [Gemmatimonadetes bacterium]|nr:PQQ-binding-like beta-propeller repeat protein [Gemmatimonadota bacterium]
MPKSVLSSQDASWSLSTRVIFDSAPTVWGGTLFYADGQAMGRNGFRTVVHAVDIQSGEPLYQSRPVEAPVTGPLCAADGRVYFGTGLPKEVQYSPDANRLFALDATTLVRVWSTQLTDPVVQQPVVADGLVMVGTTKGEFHVLSAKDGNHVDTFPLYHDQTALTDVSTAWVARDVVLFSAGVPGTDTVKGEGWVYAVDPRGQVKWTYDVGGYPSPPVASADLLFVGGEDGVVHAVHLATGASAWSWQTAGGVSTRPAFAGGVVYVASSDGNFYALDSAPDTPGDRLLWSVTYGGWGTAPVLVGGSTAYFGTSQGRLFAVDLPSRGAEVVTFDTGAQAVMAGATYQNGVVYFAATYEMSAGGTIYAAPVAEVLHEFYARTLLMADDYDVSGPEPVPTSPAYRAQVALFDHNKSPRPFVNVKVWASARATLRSGGATYAVGPDEPAWVRADATGELDLVVEATTLSVPSLSLWANFMLAEEAITLYPDQQVLERLSGVQAADLDPATARSFSGTPVLLPAYQDAGSREHIASTIRNTLGRLKPGDAGSPRYLAFPDSTPALRYRPSGGEPGRAFVPGDVPNWKVSISDSGVVFNPFDTELPEAAPGSIWGDFTDFLDDVVDGTEKFISTTWKWVDGRLVVPVDKLKDGYRFVVETVERAVAVMTGFLKQVVQDVEHVIEWLSWLFDWKDFVHAHDVILEHARRSFAGLSGWIDSEITSGISHVNDFFSQAEAGVESAFDKVIASLGATSLADARKGYRDPSSVYDAGGAAAYAPTRWLQSRVTEGLASATLGAALATGDPSPQEVIWSAFQDFLVTLAKEVGEGVADALRDVEGFFAALQPLVADPGHFSAKPLKEVLECFRGVAVSLLRFGGTVADAFLTLLRAVADAVLRLFEQTIHIPFVSDLYRQLTGNELSVFDLWALCVAVPTTLVAKATGLWDASAMPTAGDSAPKWMLLSYSFSYAQYTVLDALSDAVDLGGVGTTVYGAFGLGLTLLGLPSASGSTQWYDWVIWTAQFIPSVFTAITLAVPAGEALDLGMMWVNCGYGVVMVGTYVFAAIEWPNDYGGTRGLKLLENLLSVIPYPPKPLKLLGDPGIAFVVALDGEGDLGATILSIINWPTAQPSTGQG